MNPFDPQPVRLTGASVELEPLALDHAEALFEAGADDDIWRYMPVPRQRTVDETRVWIEQALAAQEKGTDIPFAIIDKQSGVAVGSTRYLDIRRPDRNLEIGWTWIAPAFHGTGLNAQCKLLQMAHAFEALGAVRVQLKADARNRRSLRAMEKPGFVREGVLRRQRLCWDGHYRDTVYYSVIDSEWPEIKQNLLSYATRLRNSA